MLCLHDLHSPHAVSTDKINANGLFLLWAFGGAAGQYSPAAFTPWLHSVREHGSMPHEARMHPWAHDLLTSLLVHLVAIHAENLPVNMHASQGFEGEVALVLRRHFPSTLLADLQASSQGALVELAQAFPYQPASASVGLTRFMQVPFRTPGRECSWPIASCTY